MAILGGKTPCNTYRELINCMDVQTSSRQVIIVGGGRVGRRTAAQLSESGYMVTVIERDETKRERIVGHTVSRVVVGDGTDIECFKKANPTMAGWTDRGLSKRWAYPRIDPPNSHDFVTEDRNDCFTESGKSPGPAGPRRSRVPESM
ncbi:hypothetical protein BRD09_01725 [Halobacteriales archaeon SW_10_68_16]|nr:MAG: hypothetical protein BRD09_01725 [Halobacteriales archaeon SW_10_68_16]